MTKIRYSVSIKDMHGHMFHVQTRVDGVNAGSVELVMPVWTPGSYLVRDFSRNVVRFTATDTRGRRLKWTKVTKNRWHIESRGKEIVAGYDLYANELTVRASHLDAAHAFITGSSIFMYVDGLRCAPVEVDLNPPPGWMVATGLEKVRGRNHRYCAKNYDELIDAPIEMGRFELSSFTVNGVNHRVVTCGRAEYDRRRFLRDLTRVVKEVIGFFGEVPYEEYLFIIHFVESGGGGLEHRNSTACNIPRHMFSNEKDYHKVITLLTHEFFHTWNVKRIMPEGFLSYDLEKETYSKLLWVMEGFTSYYDTIIPCRAGIYPAKRMLEMYADTIKTYIRTPGRKVETLEEASFDAWIKYYKPDENTPNVSISYYNKGAVVGLILDLYIRRETGNRRSLDDVMRYLWKEYGAAGKGIKEEEIQGIMEKVTGLDLTRFFDSYIRGTKEIRYNDFLGVAGLAFRPQKRSEDEEGKGYLGIDIRTSGDRVFVRHVYTGGPAHKSGIYANDEIIAFNGIRVDAETFKKRERALPAGKRVTVSLFRRGLLTEVGVVPSVAPSEKYLIEKVKKPSRSQKWIYEKWSGEKWRKKK